MPDIWDTYGNKSSQSEGGRASSGGPTTARDVKNYQPPQGPSNINESKTPGLHGENHGNCGTQGRH